MARSVFFIHGAWVTPLCWDNFRRFFEERGYRTQAPPWPGKEAPVEEQRRSPSPTLRGLGIKEIVDHYEALIERLPEPPVLVGHSFGGLFVQILLDRGLGRAGVAIDSAPPKGVFAFYPTAIRSLGRVLTTWRGWDRILTMPYLNFCYAFLNMVPPAPRSVEEFLWPIFYAFLNMVPPAQRRAIYDRHVVPETGRVFFQAAFSMFSPSSPARVNFRNNGRPPLLLLAGGADHIVPPQINRGNFRKYHDTASTVTFKEFPARGHWIIAEEGWEEVAGFISDWLDTLPGAA